MNAGSTAAWWQSGLGVGAFAWRGRDNSSCKSGSLPPRSPRARPLPPRDARAAAPRGTRGLSPTGRASLPRANVETLHELRSSGLSGCCRVDQVDASHQPARADFADDRQATEQLFERACRRAPIFSAFWTRSSRSMMARFASAAAHETGCPQYVPGCTFSSGPFLVEGISDLCARDRGGQRQVTRRDAFRDRHQVGHDVFMLHAEPLAGAPEAGDDFVRNHQHFVVVADVAHALEPAERRDDAAAASSAPARADGSDGFGIRGLVWRAASRSAQRRTSSSSVPVAAIAERVRHRDLGEAVHRRSRTASSGPGCRKPKRAEGAAVITALQ